MISFVLNMNSLNFNIDNGYLEGLVRGFKAGILKQSDYANLVQCETLEGKYCCASSVRFDNPHFNLLAYHYSVH